METEDFIFDYSGKRQEVEKLSEELPDVCVSVFSLALIVKAIDLRDLSGLVISPQNCDSVSESNLQSNQEGDSFNRVIAPVNVVPHE